MIGKNWRFFFFFSKNKSKRKRAEKRERKKTRDNDQCGTCRFSLGNQLRKKRCVGRGGERRGRGGGRVKGGAEINILRVKSLAAAVLVKTNHVRLA